MLKRGGMGVVFLAHDLKKNRLVALKLVEPGTDDASRDAIRAEEYGAKLQQALARVDSHVPQVRGFGTLHGRFFIDIEYVRGEDLSSVMGRQRLSYASIFRIGAALCSTLESAHELTTEIDGQRLGRLYHGDVKPQNIRLTPDGQVKLLDFGIAKGSSLTRSMTYNDFGTLEYCSPERLDSGLQDVSSDLWSVGILLYEMAAGQKPFPAQTRHELLARFREGRPPDPLPADCPRLLREVVDKSLSFDPARRFCSAAELGRHLQAFNQGVTQRSSQWPKGADAAVNSSNAWEDITLYDDHISSLDTGRPPAPLPMRIALALGLMACALFAIVESRAWQRRARLGEELASATVLRQADVEELWARYKEETGGEGVFGRGVLGLGLQNLSARMRQKLHAVAEHVIKDSEKEKPDLKETSWLEAKTCLTRAIEIDGGDRLAKAMLHYCDGHLDRINGDALRRDGRHREAESKHRKAIEHFNDAAVIEPQWPAPHLGLALVYTYGLFDLDRATKALERSKTLGMNLGQRETAISADSLRRHGDQLYDNLERSKSRSSEDYRHVLSQYELSLEKNRQIPNFTRHTRENIRHLEKRIREVKDRLHELDTAEIQQASAGEGSL